MSPKSARSMTVRWEGDYSKLSDKEVSALLEMIADKREREGELHMLAVFPAMGAVMFYEQVYTQLFGEPKVGDRLARSEILVCPATMPAWTPLFAIASGVVTDHGGVLSHTAIVAREYQIPAVVGTKLGTSLIQDGQTISVDGNEGTVTLK